MLCMMNPTLRTKYALGVVAVCLGCSLIACNNANQDDMPGDMLSVHTAFRQNVGVPALTWSGTLASHAQSWADTLAARGGCGLEHASGIAEGENLWAGTTGAYGFEAMAESWADERSNFVPGVFPDVSKTGNWADVGHYTQMIWRDTTEVGCGMGSSNECDFLACRYAPPGNVTGKTVF